MRTSRIFAFIASLIFSLVATPAQASFKSVMIDGLNSIGAPSDQVELFAYSVDHPDYSATIFARAVAQDYPFFALVGAAKAGKKAGILSESDCKSPVTVVTDTFDHADQYVSSQSAKAKTGQATDVMIAYADEYRKQQTEAAKQQVLQEASAAIPYYGDLPVICSFAFQTNLNAEDDIQNVASHLIRTTVKAYSQLSNGDYLDGVGTLMEAGFSKELACGLLESGMESAVGNPLGVSSLAGSACSGILGATYEAMSEGAQWALDKAESVGCAIVSIFGGCSDSPPPPPTGLSNAEKFCAPNGGLASFSSASNAPDEFSVICNNHAMCRVKPGNPPVCATAEEWRIANNARFANAAKDRDRVIDGFASRCQFECRVPIALIMQSQYLTLMKMHEADPSLPYAEAYSQTLDSWGPIGKEIESAIQNKQFEVLPPRWGNLQNSLAQGNCEDDDCRLEVKFLVTNALLRVKQEHAKSPYQTYSVLSAGPYADALIGIKNAVDKSKQRLVMAGLQKYNEAKDAPTLHLPPSGTVPQTDSPMPPGGLQPSSAAPVQGLSTNMPPVTEPTPTPIKVLPGMIATNPTANPEEGGDGAKSKAEKRREERKKRRD